jgi:hypothetical protein
MGDSESRPASPLGPGRSARRLREYAAAHCVTAPGLEVLWSGGRCLARTLPMDFSPEHLKHYLVSPPQGAVASYEYFDRRALINAVPERSREAYMEAAEKWVADSGGRHFGPGAATFGGRYYMLPTGRVPFV